LGLMERVLSGTADDGIGEDKPDLHGTVA